MKVIDEIAENTYSSTTLAEALTDTKYRDGIIYLSVPLYCYQQGTIRPLPGLSPMIHNPLNVLV